MTNETNPQPLTGVALYARYALAGATCTAITHGMVTPVDVVKTRIQLEPTQYKGGMISAAKKIIANEGAGALLTGIGPTVLGYFLQGAFKFGGYEFFKRQAVDYLGPEKSAANRTLIYLGSSACAEFMADIALCPLEATRIRLVSDPTFAKGLMSGFTRLVRDEGIAKGLYSGFTPILFKQIPYTMAKFAVFEWVSDMVYSQIKTPKEQLANSTITAINLSSGLAAGVVAACVSQPADTMLSKINKKKKAGEAVGSITSRLFAIGKELGLKGLFVGLGPRIVMVGALTAGQFGIYGDVKRMLGAKGGTEIGKNSH